MNWSEVREKLSNVKKRATKRRNYYLDVMSDLVEAGFRLATPEIEAAYTAMVGKYSEDLCCWPYFEFRKSTYPSIRKTEPNKYGLYAYGTHARSEDIDSAVEMLAELHADDIEAGRVWLMPVRDDSEYVSWDFDVAVGTEEEVVEILKKAVPLTQQDSLAYLSQ